MENYFFDRINSSNPTYYLKFLYIIIKILPINQINYTFFSKTGSEHIAKSKEINSSLHLQNVSGAVGHTVVILGTPPMLVLAYFISTRAVLWAPVNFIL
ncbi:hypothetical protein PIROE2DRAFT_9976 [Piromyces sp. E2]|nr:hypothetical protein PIROE2DRAFT_9976 [Piromyces sp. E2]|eukprot:OUM63488.1 hypothetical protein PIROE2DRAFT_9976 [Piromyces sp. E2]